jgi:K+ potassium transporter
MFADLGHFSRPAIQLAFIFVVLPALFCMCECSHTFDHYQLSTSIDTQVHSQDAI